MAWLDDHPPARSQFRCPRRALERGVIVVHTAESVMDTVGPDTGAENVARYIQTRDTPGSYHDLVDADSTINLVRDGCEAFHDATGSNPWSWSLSFACSYLDWSKMTKARRDAFIENGARRAAYYAKRLKARRGIEIPAKRITRAQSEAGARGFISHAERDPDRRKDPGNAAGQFPWAQFLARYAQLVPWASAPPEPNPEDDMPQPFLCKLVVDGQTRPETLLVSASRDSAHWIRSSQARAGHQLMIALAGGDTDVQVLDIASDDDNNAHIAHAVLNLPLLGRMPDAYKPLWKGPHYPSAGT